MRNGRSVLSISRGMDRSHSAVRNGILSRNGHLSFPFQPELRLNGHSVSSLPSSSSSASSSSSTSSSYSESSDSEDSDSSGCSTGRRPDLIIRAHRLFLEMSCSGLESLLYRDLGQRIFTVNQCKPNDFKALIDFIYMGECVIDAVEQARGVYNIAKFYQCHALVNFIAKFVSTSIKSFRFTPRTCGNLLFFLEFARELQERELENTCWGHMDRYAARIVNTPDFLSIPEATVKSLLSRDSFDIGDELVKFLAVKRWGDYQVTRTAVSNCRTLLSVQEAVADLLPFVRFELISESDFIRTVLPSGLLGVRHVISFCMVRGVSVPRSVASASVATTYKSLITCSDSAASNSCQRCLRFRCAFKLEREQLNKVHEIRLQVDRPVQLAGLCLGYLFSQLEMGITVRIQGPFERVQWTDIYSQYFPVSANGLQADMYVWLRQLVSLEPDLCYKVVVKVDRWTSSGEDFQIWGGQSGPSRVRTASGIRVYFLQAAVEKGCEIPFANMDACRGLITELFFRDSS